MPRGGSSAPAKEAVDDPAPACVTVWDCSSAVAQAGCGHPTIWTILQEDGPNHLGLRHNELPEHQKALITSGCVPCSDATQLLTDEETLETEMLQLFASQDSWERRNVLVRQKAADFSFDVGWETITQRQDHETQSRQGETGGVVWDAAVRPRASAIAAPPAAADCPAAAAAAVRLTAPRPRRSCWRGSSTRIQKRSGFQSATVRAAPDGTAFCWRSPLHPY